MTALDRQYAEGRTACESLTNTHGELREQYKAAIDAGLIEAIETLRRDVADITVNNQLCHERARKTGDYVEWMKWALWDLPDFAIAIRPNLQTFRRAAPACGLIYLAGRILDDFLDRHYHYRGQPSTLLATMTEGRVKPSEGESLTVLAAVLLCFQGLHVLSSCGPEILTQVIDPARRLILGIVMERSGRDEWDNRSYERLIRLKNVDYWRILYAAIDPQCTSPLYQFLCEYYAFAQKVNDVQDYARDEEQGRPNLISILRKKVAAGDDVTRLTASTMAEELLQLGEAARQLPDLERSIALYKLSQVYDDLRQLGVFARETAPAQPSTHGKLGLIWHSRLDEFVARCGPDILEETACPVCGENMPGALFRKQGFLVNRCGGCTHVYVSPRLRCNVQQKIADELDGVFEDPFLGVQRVYSESLCRLLRRKAPGPRMLDIGFGSGHLMRAARAFGFQTYGIETSAKLAEGMAPMFGHRVSKLHIGEEPLPWGQFDVITMSHVLEHMARPTAVVTNIREALRPGGLVYIAVPDIESLQFRIFGKRWDAVNPVPHYQFFNQASLALLLTNCGLEVLGRVRQPAYEGPGRQAYMTFFRRLGGDESGELALLACAPPEPRQTSAIPDLE